MPAAELSASLRRYLYLTASITGGAIMIIEILGAKMLAPFVGTSHFVWTAQIAVTMIALAVGYYVGGRWADGSPRLGRLYFAIVAAALYLCLTIPMVKPVAHHCLRFKLAVGSLLTSLFLFFVPLALLAMTGPFLIRVLTQAVTSVGGNAGRLTAISTLGSFVGTALIGYALIPFFANSTIMFGTAAVLMVVALVYFALWERKGVVKTVVVMLAGSLVAWSGIRQDRKMVQNAEATELYRVNSNFGQLQVMQSADSGMRYLLNDLLWQNTYAVKEKKSLSTFTYMLHGLARAYTPEIKRALCVGMGVGIVPREFASEGVKVDAIEINPAMAEIAERFFDCDLSQFEVIYADGRDYLNRCTERYDTVILDAFLGDSSPSHLMTREAFESMSSLMNSNATLVINVLGSLDPRRDFFLTSLHKTLGAVFKNVKLHVNAYGNNFFVVSNGQKLTVIHPPQWNEVHPMSRADVEQTFAQVQVPYAKRGIVLTDDYNPVEFYDSENREIMRRRFVASSMGKW